MLFGIYGDDHVVCVECFFSIYGDDHVVFVFLFVDVVYDVDGFSNVVPSLHTWDEYHLVKVYDPFDVFLDSFC